MKTAITTHLHAFVAKYHIPWVVLYAAFFVGAGVFATSVYREYSEHVLPEGYIELRVSKTQYQPGEVVEFTVVNHFPTPVYVTNECPEEPLNVYRWENNAWVQLHERALSPDSECYQEARNVLIPSEGSRTYSYKDWPHLFERPGVYRIAAALDYYNELPFQDFVVLKPAVTVQTPVPAPAAPTPAPTETPQITVSSPEGEAVEEPIVAPEPIVEPAPESAATEPEDVPVRRGEQTSEHEDD
jgi:hypothetical protein